MYDYEPVKNKNSIAKPFVRLLKKHTKNRETNIIGEDIVL